MSTARHFQRKSLLAGYVTPCVMNISILHDSVAVSIGKMKANKSCGPDNVSPKLPKYAGKNLILSLLSQFSMSAERNSAPTS